VAPSDRAERISPAAVAQRGPEQTLVLTSATSGCPCLPRVRPCQVPGIRGSRGLISIFGLMDLVYAFIYTVIGIMVPWRLMNVFQGDPTFIRPAIRRMRVRCLPAFVCGTQSSGVHELSAIDHMAQLCMHHHPPSSARRSGA
jgi:hypothetical protein